MVGVIFGGSIMARRNFFAGLYNVWKLMARRTTESKEGQWLNVPKVTNDKDAEKREIAKQQFKKILLD